MWIVVSGRVDRDLNRLCFKVPEWEPLTNQLLHTAQIVPVYPQTEGITSRQLRKLTRGVVDIFRHEWAYDSDDAIRELGYRITPLADGVARTIANLSVGRGV